MLCSLFLRLTALTHKEEVFSQLGATFHLNISNHQVYVIIHQAFVLHWDQNYQIFNNIFNWDISVSAMSFKARMSKLFKLRFKPDVNNRSDFEISFVSL